jgi:hypothetical protein
VPIITSTMLIYDPKTYLVRVIEPPRTPDPTPPAAPLGRTLAGLAAAGLATRLLEAAVSRRRR